jgi:single-stranded DNA-binding protein
MNNFILSCTLVQQPELRYTSEQKPVCSSLVEFTEVSKDATKSIVRVVAWGQVADALRSLPVGTSVIAEGSLRMNKVETPEGRKRTVPEFNISRLEAINPSRAVDTEVTEVGNDTPLDDDGFPF